MKEYQKQWYKNNKEKVLKNNKKWLENHPEYMNQWREKNPEYDKQCSKKFRENNPEYTSLYYQKTKDKNRIQCKKWRKSNQEKLKIIEKRHRNKRERNLGFNPLNRYFEDSEAHHINNNDIIYIPKGIHQSIRHCLETNKNMEKINKLAMNYI